MNTSGIENIFFPSDFSPESQVAFAHALKIALVARANLDIAHVSSHGDVDWTEFPGVRETLIRWQLLPEGSSRGDVAKLGINVRKAVVYDDDPVRGCMKYLQNNPIDLVVLATAAHQGRMSWLHRSVAEPVARQSGEVSLFIPHGVSGFVDAPTGHLSLTRILIAVATAPKPQPALVAATRLIERIGGTAGTVTVLHVGSPAEMARCELPRDSSWTWNGITKSGAVVNTIVTTARELNADLIVMATAGRNGFMDMLRGSTTEQVLREAPCPILAVPSPV